MKSADAVHFFNRRFEQTFHGYSDESSAKELSREKKTERVTRRVGEIARYSDFQPTSTLTFPYDLLTGLEESEGKSEELRGNFGLRGNNRLDTENAGETRKNITTPKIHELTAVERRISSDS